MTFDGKELHGTGSALEAFRRPEGPTPSKIDGSVPSGWLDEGRCSSALGEARTTPDISLQYEHSAFCDPTLNL
jgi:hypothetical protein